MRFLVFALWVLFVAGASASDAVIRTQGLVLVSNEDGTWSCDYPFQVVSLGWPRQPTICKLCWDCHSSRMTVANKALSQTTFVNETANTQGQYFYFTDGLVALTNVTTDGPCLIAIGPTSTTVAAARFLSYAFVRMFDAPAGLFSYGNTSQLSWFNPYAPDSGELPLVNLAGLVVNASISCPNVALYNVALSLNASDTSLTLPHVLAQKVLAGQNVFEATFADGDVITIHFSSGYSITIRPSQFILQGSDPSSETLTHYTIKDSGNDEPVATLGLLLVDHGAVVDTEKNTVTLYKTHGAGMTDTGWFQLAYPLIMCCYFIIMVACSLAVTRWAIPVVVLVSTMSVVVACTGLVGSELSQDLIHWFGLVGSLSFGTAVQWTVISWVILLWLLQVILFFLGPEHNWVRFKLVLIFGFMHFVVVLWHFLMTSPFTQASVYVIALPCVASYLAGHILRLGHDVGTGTIVMNKVVQQPKSWKIFYSVGVIWSAVSYPAFALPAFYVTFGANARQYVPILSSILLQLVLTVAGMLNALSPVKQT